MQNYVKFCSLLHHYAITNETYFYTHAIRLSVNELSTLVFQPCDARSPELMHCLTPKVDVPQAFEDFGKGPEPAENRRRRSLESFDHSKPDEQEAVIHDENHLARRYPRSIEQEDDKTLIAENEALDFYLGFKLDGVQSYTNLSDTKDMVKYAKFTYYSQQPEIPVVEFEPFVPYSGMKIHIQVDLVFSCLYKCLLIFS